MKAAHTYYFRLAQIHASLGARRRLGLALRPAGWLCRLAAAASEDAVAACRSQDAADMLRLWVSVKGAADLLEAHGACQDSLRRLRAAQSMAGTSLQEGYGMDLDLPVGALLALAQEADRQDPREDAALLAAMLQVLDDPGEDPEVIREIRHLLDT
ncbi:MAG: hypothetical protein NW241_10895 [Bacteroidia bacterium]|nr:hypothetical protein [Bacteroidia bacterium]